MKLTCACACRSKSWSYSVQVSLKNFLSTALCRFPRPKILGFMVLKKERMQFRSTIQQLKEKLNDADFVIRSLHQQLTVLTTSRARHRHRHRDDDDEDEDEDRFETNKLINKAIEQYQSDSIHGGRRIITDDSHSRSKTGSSTSSGSSGSKHSRSQSQIHEKYFRSGASPRIGAVKQTHLRSQTVCIANDGTQITHCNASGCGCVFRA